LIAEHREVSRHGLERLLFLNVVCIEVPAKETLDEFQTEPLEKPEPPVWWVDFLGDPSVEVSNYSDFCSEWAMPFEVVSHSHHFPPGRALVVSVGFWVWLLEECIPVDDGQRRLGIALGWCH
jgi:hypothetical protein